MTVWHKGIVEKLRSSGLFGQVSLLGAKVRASIDETRYLDMHFDPTTQSYSYALVDLGLPSPGDKRLFGWDDYPHEGVLVIRQLESYPHHFQKRAEDGGWIFEVSPMRGDIDRDVDAVVTVVRAYLQQ